MKTHDQTLRESILEQVVTYLENQLERPLGASPTAASRIVADLHLDSMEGMLMLSALEDHYGITIPLQVLQQAATLDDIVTAVVAALQPSGKES